MITPWTKPPRTVGSGRPGNWTKWVEDAIRALRPIKTTTVNFGASAKGIRYNSASGGAGGTTVQLCVITELFGGAEDQAFDYIGVTPYDADSDSLTGSQFICAKCITGRGPATELIDGDIETYSQYLMDNQRLDTLPDLSTEFHAMHPRYIVYPGPMPYPIGFSIEQCQVYVCRTVNPTGVLDTGGNDIYYIENQPNRYWAWSPSLNGV